jgi:23S rRNA pseudouridine2605 synthase
MRLNKYVALASGLSRRAADSAISEGRVDINGQNARLGQIVGEEDKVSLDGNLLSTPEQKTAILFNKPAGYVCSRAGQGDPTIYELLPDNYQRLKPAGRLDKDSHGLVLLTDDGELIQELIHPSKIKNKIYALTLDRSLQNQDYRAINDDGIELEDGISKLALDKINESDKRWQVTMHEGRNRQIRRTFGKLGYSVIDLERLAIGPYELGDLGSGKYRNI